MSDAAIRNSPVGCQIWPSSGNWITRDSRLLEIELRPLDMHHELPVENSWRPLLLFSTENGRARRITSDWEAQRM
jgi:hypothetical protein